MELTIDDRRMACEVVGAGPAILFVHGFPLTAEIWRPTAQRLSGWKCILPDLRGHGGSHPTPEASIADLTDDLVAVLDVLDERQPVVLVGLSLGGVIAFEFFRRYRHRLRALVLTDCRPTPEGDPDAREKLAESVLRSGSRVAADTMVAKLFSPHTSVELKQAWHAIMAATPPEGVAATARALKNRADSRATMPQIDVPTLLVFGADDVITPPEIGEDMQAAIPGAALEVLPRAGHLPPIEQPDRYAEVLETFLGKLPALPG